MPARSRKPIPPKQPADIEAIDAIVQAAMQASDVPGCAIAVVKDDEVVFLKGFGVKELGKSDPVTPETVFAIGSTTKAFTTTAIAMLVEDGKMAWEDPVRKHAPFFRLSDPLADAHVTLRDLVCHRTGLGRHDTLWYKSPWSREEIIRKIGLVNPNTSFRSRYEYQNIMFLTAGYAAGLAAGSTWEELIRTRIFEPLGMTGANFSAADAEAAPDHASPHEKKQRGKVKQKVIEVVPWCNLDNAGPVGSINAGARDLSKWVRFQLAGGEFEGRRLLAEAALAETHTPQTVMAPDEPYMSYGLGWTINPNYQGERVISHGGAIDGFITQIALVPEQKLGIVVLSNFAPTWLPVAVRNSLIDSLLGLPAQDWNTQLADKAKEGEEKQAAQEREREKKRHRNTKPSRELSAYTGAYEEPAYGTVSVTLENRSLAVQWSSFTSKLVH